MNVKKQLSALDKTIRPTIRYLSRQAKRDKVNVYLVGGFVRDMFLERRNLDLDIVIEGDAIAFAKKLAKEMKGRLTVHRQFATATVSLPSGRWIDCATARSERYPYSGALPVISRGSIHADLFRRDFTINAMAVALRPDRFGKLIDDFHGMSDLKKRVVRILHTYSFIDDPTRILRAVRFEQRFGFRIEHETLRLLKSAVCKGVIGNVKPPRYFEEFKKLLEEPHPAKYIRRLGMLSGLSYINGALKPASVNFRLFDHMEKDIAWFEQKFPDKGTLSRWLLFFMVLIDRISQRNKEYMAEEFNFTKEARRMLTESRDINSIVTRLSREGLAPHQIYATLKPLSYETTLFAYTKIRNSVVRKRIEDFLYRYDSVRLEITGGDLKRMGIASGCGMGRILQTLLYQKIDGKIKTPLDERKTVASLK